MRWRCKSHPCCSRRSLMEPSIWSRERTRSSRVRRESSLLPRDDAQYSADLPPLAMRCTKRCRPLGRRMAKLSSESQIRPTMGSNWEGRRTYLAYTCGSSGLKDLPRPADSRRDRDMETIWCSEFSRLQELLAASGSEMVIERAVEAGVRPVKRFHSRKQTGRSAGDISKFNGGSSGIWIDFPRL